MSQRNRKRNSDLNSDKYRTAKKQKLNTHIEHHSYHVTSNSSLMLRELLNGVCCRISQVSQMINNAISNENNNGDNNDMNNKDNQRQENNAIPKDFCSIENDTKVYGKNCFIYDCEKVLQSLDKKRRFEACQSIFMEIANTILKDYVLLVGDAPHTKAFEILEVEMYCSHPLFPDPYVHGAVEQNRSGRWYFHKTGNTYKGGSYKGLDVTVGGTCHITGDQMRGGLLIRTIRSIDDENKIITGPSLCVDEILRICNQSSIANLVSTWESLDAFCYKKNLNIVGKDEIRDSIMRLASDKLDGYTDVTSIKSESKHKSQVESTLNASLLDKKLKGTSLTSNSLFRDYETIITTSLRVGIHLNKKKDAQDYCYQLLRYVAHAPLVKKGKNEMILGQLYEGASLEAISKRIGVTRASIESKIESWNRGRKKQYLKYLNVSKPKVDEYCEIVGSVHEYMKSNYCL